MKHGKIELKRRNGQLLIDLIYRWSSIPIIKILPIKRLLCLIWQKIISYIAIFSANYWPNSLLVTACNEGIKSSFFLFFKILAINNSALLKGEAVSYVEIHNIIYQWILLSCNSRLDIIAVETMFNPLEITYKVAYNIQNVFPAPGCPRITTYFVNVLLLNILK